MLYLYISILGYVFVGALIVFSLYLVFLMVRTVLPERKNALIAAIAASILWGISVPSSLLLAFMGLMGSGGPNTIAWLFLMTEGSLILLLLLSLYSLSNVWQRYSMEDYRYVIRYAAVPYIAIILSIIPMWVQHAHYVDIENSTKRNSPPSGFLIPKTSFPLDGFKETSRKYGIADISVSYESINGDATVSSLILKENTSTYEGMVKGHSGKVYEFTYEGRPGVVFQSDVFSSPGEKNLGRVEYNLYWDDNGKRVDITLTNIVKSDDYPRKLEGVLESMDRVE